MCDVLGTVSERSWDYEGLLRRCFKPTQREVSEPFVSMYWGRHWHGDNNSASPIVRECRTLALLFCAAMVEDE
jgi:hypothetical protein